MKKILLLLIFPISVFSQNFNSDREKIQHALDSMHYPLNKPKPPNGFTLYYNCDSIPFMKKVNGDTIEIYKKGGFTPLYYSSQYSFDNFLYFIAHPDSNDVSYLSGFYSDGRIIKENPTYTQFIYRNDSLFDRFFNDNKFLEYRMKYGFAVMSGEMNSLKAEEKIREARAKYKGFWEENYVFSKKMFQNTNQVIIDKKLNRNKPKVVLVRQWKRNNLICYHIDIVENSSAGESHFEYIFDDDINFIEWESCEE